MNDLNWQICKFQTDSSGRSLMVYSEDRVTVNIITSDPEKATTVINHLRMGHALDKCYAYAAVDDKGQLHVYKRVEDQPW